MTDEEKAAFEKATSDYLAHHRHRGDRHGIIAALIVFGTLIIIVLVGQCYWPAR